MSSAGISDVTKTWSFSPEVRKALDEGTPIVALESTIISHGMPYPQNVECANALQDILREKGCTPATVGILDGVVHMGMSPEQLEIFGKLGPKCHKVSRRDVGFVCGLKKNGATTVSATMLLASMAGVRVFVTGGLGGVHRGASDTWDVSADLTEMGRTPMCVVCAGAKSILDLPKTMEVLETQGVAVLGWKTSDFPAFFTRKSGLKCSAEVTSAEEMAAILDSQYNDFNLQSSIVVANPIPEGLEAKYEPTTRATEQALKESVEQKITGRDATPFLLGRICELTGGDSLTANLALVKNNAAVGGEIAAAWYALQKKNANGSPAKKARTA